MREVALPVTREPGRGDIHAADGRFLGTLPYHESATQILAALNDHAALQAQVAALTAERDRLEDRLRAQTETVLGMARRAFYEVTAIRTGRPEPQERAEALVGQIIAIVGGAAEGVQP